MSSPDQGRPRAAVIGAAGRMGRSILGALAEDGELECGAAVVSPAHPWVGRRLEEVGAPGAGPIFGELAAALSGVSVIIDFTRPGVTAQVARAAAAAGLPLVTGTTGLTAEDHAALEEAAGEAAVVVAPNMSVGVAALIALVREAARKLGPGWDAEILDLHHKAKRDSPSGTAAALGEAIARVRGGALADVETLRGRGETGPRAQAELGIAALRGGDVVGEHTVFFLGAGERLELTHRATDRGIFARGAVRAARWALSAPPGLYGMADVLG